MTFVQVFWCPRCGGHNLVRWGTPEEVCHHCATVLQCPMDDPRWTDPARVNDPFVVPDWVTPENLRLLDEWERRQRARPWWRRTAEALHHWARWTVRGTLRRGWQRWWWWAWGRWRYAAYERALAARVAAVR